MSKNTTAQLCLYLIRPIYTTQLLHKTVACNLLTTWFPGYMRQFWANVNKLSLVRMQSCNYLNNIRESFDVSSEGPSSGLSSHKTKGLRLKRRNSPYIFLVVASLPTKACYYWHYLHCQTAGKRCFNRVNRPFNTSSCNSGARNV
jgi:hypothetical protein